MSFHLVFHLGTVGVMDTAALVKEVRRVAVDDDNTKELCADVCSGGLKVERDVCAAALVAAV